MSTLPSRFQIGDSVRVGRTPGQVLGLSFEAGKIRYYVATKAGPVGPVPSEDVEPPAPFTVIEGGAAMTERIVAAACIFRGEVVSLPPPARHHTIIQHLAALHPEAPRPIVGAGGEQGFVTESGRYVGRREGMRIAIKAGQVDRQRWSHPLYSEDLW